MSDRAYQNLIFTKHAWERLRLRSLRPELIAQTLDKPDRSTPSDKPNSVKFIRTLNERTIHAVGTYLPDQKKWLIISVWVRGEDDPVPLAWQVVTAPFKLIWWLLRRVLR